MLTKTKINLNRDDPFNKAIYIFLIPYKGLSNPKKRKIKGKLVFNITMVICLIVLVVLKDFLGIMLRQVCYLTKVSNITKYIQGLLPNL